MELSKSPITFREGWIEQNLSILIRKHDIPEEKHGYYRSKLASIYDERIKRTKINVVNNYKNMSIRSDTEEVANLILSQKVIVGGDGVLYKQHETEKSFFVPIIIDLQKERSDEKSKRDEYTKGTDEWLYHNLGQSNKKIIINALYGLLGYSRFQFFNVNLAQSVTAMGQNIISTAACAFENFLSDNTKFLTFTEILMYIDMICNECDSIEAAYSSIFDLIPEITMEELVLRIRNRTYHIMTEEQSLYIVEYLRNLSPNQKKLLYYKNNFLKFNELPFMVDKLQEVMNNIQILKLGELYAFDPACAEKTGTVATDKAPSLITELLDIYDKFVLVTHPVFDRARRTQYTTKKSVLYIDTDSNFIGLDRFITQFSNLTRDKFNNRADFIFKSASIMTMILSFVVKRNFEDFTDSLNITLEYAKRLKMKNEFFFSIMLFGLVKKRYIGNMILQEGKLIKDGAGEVEVKGYDFKKAGTKKEVREYISGIIERCIIQPEQVNISDIYKECDAFKDKIRDDIKSGSNLYYRQLSVSVASRYKLPYSNQGVKGTIVWNAFNPDNIIELPAEVDIVPINLFEGFTEKSFEKFLDDPVTFYQDPKNLNKQQNLYNFMKKYPRQFELFMDGYVNNKNLPDEVRHKIVTSIAKPRYLSELPEWLPMIIDNEKIESTVINLINPIMESLGSVLLKGKTGPMYSTIVNF